VIAANTRLHAVRQRVGGYVGHFGILICCLQRGMGWNVVQQAQCRLADFDKVSNRLQTTGYKLALRGAPVV
jgi:hypothetical protein